MLGIESRATASNVTESVGSAEQFVMVYRPSGATFAGLFWLCSLSKKALWTPFRHKKDEESFVLLSTFWLRLSYLQSEKLK